MALVVESVNPQEQALDKWKNVTVDRNLLVAATGMIAHLDLMREGSPEKRTPLEQLGGAMGESIATAALAIADKARANGGSHPGDTN